jgi:hypothetical protein
MLSAQVGVVVPVKDHAPAPVCAWASGSAMNKNNRIGTRMGDKNATPPPTGMRRMAVPKTYRIN